MLSYTRLISIITDLCVISTVELIEATRRSSDGGRKITRAEYEAWLEVVKAKLGDALVDLVTDDTTA